MRVRRFGNQLLIASPAKLNLFLELLGKRDDGYHDIETIMTTVSLCDDLVLGLSKNESDEAPTDRLQLKLVARSSPQVASDEDVIPVDDNNLVLRALGLLRKRAEAETGQKLPGIDASLFKRIPSAAGLGGASSNAASALAGASRLWNLNWPHAALASLASELGSDVPFFLTAGTAICHGRGEIIKSIAGIDGLAVVIVKPPVSFSTPEMFSKVQLADPVPSKAVVQSLRGGKTQWLGDQLFNRFGEVAESLSEQVRTVRDCFGQTPALGHQLSGSGSSYFGIYANHRLARRAAKRLSAQCPLMKVIQTASISFQASITNPDTAA